MNAIIAILLKVLAQIAILYAWAGVCFLFFRYFRPETESRMKGFLEYHHEFFASHTVGFWNDVVVERDLTRKMVQRAGWKGWGFIVLQTLILSLSGFKLWICLLGVGLLFMGGLMVAYSWYGLRCFRLLGIDAYTKQ